MNSAKRKMRRVHGFGMEDLNEEVRNRGRSKRRQLYQIYKSYDSHRSLTQELKDLCRVKLP